MSIQQPVVRRSSVCLPGGRSEPIVSAERLLAALEAEGVEHFRPLLPVGYLAGVNAYRRAVDQLKPDDLTHHYTHGLAFFRDVFVPRVKQVLAQLSGGVWSFRDYVGYAAGSDVDFMTHIVEAASAKSGVSLFPGDWHGFRAGATFEDGIEWTEVSRKRLACLCIPSVRNGQFTDEMNMFLNDADACLLNINLYPTLTAEERQHVAEALSPVLEKSMLSISFSRGFGLTASQLGVVLVHRDHSYRQQFERQWSWFSYFYNAIAARAFMAMDIDAVQSVDERRRVWVRQWLVDNDLPQLSTGSYYVKSFHVDGEFPEVLRPLVRDDVVRLCLKPPLN